MRPFTGRRYHCGEMPRLRVEHAPPSRAASRRNAVSRGDLRAHAPGHLKTLGHGLEALRTEDGHYSYRCTCSFACAHAWSTRSEALGNYYIHRLLVHHIPVPDRAANSYGASNARFNGAR